MPGPQTGPLPQSPPGLLELKVGTCERTNGSTRLRPWAMLPRLRPLKLTAFIQRLHRYERTIIGLRLLESHFPEAVQRYDNLARVGWWELLAHLANLIEEQEWFEIDWSALNQAWAYWMQDPREHGDHLALFLHYLPVKHYGLSPETIIHFPPLELLYVLLDGAAGAVSSELLVAVELYDSLEAWDEPDREAAWGRLQAIEADPGRCPEPLRWLPELARWACRRTGNPLLDRQFDLTNGPWLEWRSASDLETIKAAWRRARPLLEQFHRLTAWAEEHSHLAALAHFLMEGTDREQLNW